MDIKAIANINHIPIPLKKLKIPWVSSFIILILRIFLVFFSSYNGHSKKLQGEG